MQLVKVIPLVSMHDQCPLMSPAGVEDLSLKDHATTDTSQEIPSSLNWDLLEGILGFYFANVSKSYH